MRTLIFPETIGTRRRRVPTCCDDAASAAESALLPIHVIPPIKCCYPPHHAAFGWSGRLQGDVRQITARIFVGRRVAGSGLPEKEPFAAVRPQTDEKNGRVQDVRAIGHDEAHRRQRSQAQRDEVTEMQQEWKNVLGVNVDTEDVEYNTLIGDVSQGAANPLQFFWGPGWIEDYPDPEDWLTLQFDIGQSQNNMNYGQNNSSAATEQQAVQKELEQADVEQDPTKRLAMYNDAEQKLSNDVAWLPMEQSNNFGLRKPCVKGVPPNIQGIAPPDDWANVYITTNPQCANLTVSS